MPIKIIISFIFSLVLFCGCEKTYLDRIPIVPVNVEFNLSLFPNISAQYTSQLFVNTAQEKIPTNFAYTVAQYTGYGGIWLVNGLGEQLESRFYAFDAACPVEATPNIRLVINDKELLPVAICPKCHSQFQVDNGSGAPIAGEAFDKRYFMRRYNVAVSFDRLRIFR